MSAPNPLMSCNCDLCTNQIQPLPECSTWINIIQFVIKLLTKQFQYRFHHTIQRVIPYMISHKLKICDRDFTLNQKWSSSVYMVLSSKN